MADESGAKSVHATTTSTTAESVALTSKVRHVRITNRDNTNTMYVTVATSRTSSAGAEAGVTTAVAAADETISLLPLQTKTVGRTKVPLFYAFSVIGNASAYSVEGSVVGFDE